MRRHRHEPQPIGETEAFDPHFDCRCDEATPEWMLSQEQQSQLVLQAIQSLPRHFREVLRLRYGQGRTYQEIATHTGVPAGTVMSRLCRARRQLAVTVVPPAPRTGARS